MIAGLCLPELVGIPLIACRLIRWKAHPSAWTVQMRCLARAAGDRDPIGTVCSTKNRPEPRSHSEFGVRSSYPAADQPTCRSGARPVLGPDGRRNFPQRTTCTIRRLPGSTTAGTPFTST